MRLPIDRRQALALAAAMALGAASPIPAVAMEPVTFKAADGVAVFADTYPARGRARAAILLFHQAGGSAAEYAGIAPRLADAGFDAIAVDQRSGGSGFGRVNRTVAALGGATGYLAALPDLEAALAFAKARTPGQKIIVWGSSYSASLVFLLAAGHRGDVAALLAFSPGEYLGGARVREAAAKVACPVFVTSASAASEISAARTIVAAAGGQAIQYAPKQGVHGSSTLDVNANPRGAADNWSAVEAFLAKAAP